MRKVIMLNRVSVDGYFAGPNGEIDWFIQDPELDQASHEMMHPDTLLLGRVTYDMFYSYWPNVKKDPNAPAGARKLADELSEMNKVVFSKTMKKADWENSRLIHDGVVDQVKKLKQGQGGDITIFGSGTIVQQLERAGLIDEYLVALTPVVLGKGKPLFADAKKDALELKETRKFKTGNMLLHYKTKPA